MVEGGEGVTGRVWVKQGWSREGKGPQEIRRTGVRDTEGVACEILGDETNQI